MLFGTLLLFVNSAPLHALLLSKVSPFQLILKDSDPFLSRPHRAYRLLKGILTCSMLSFESYYLFLSSLNARLKTIDLFCIEFMRIGELLFHHSQLIVEALNLRLQVLDEVVFRADFIAETARESSFTLKSLADIHHVFVESFILVIFVRTHLLHSLLLQLQTVLLSRTCTCQLL